MTQTDTMQNMNKLLKWISSLIDINWMRRKKDENSFYLIHVKSIIHTHKPHTCPHGCNDVINIYFQYNTFCFPYKSSSSSLVLLNAADDYGWWWIYYPLYELFLLWWSKQFLTIIEDHLTWLYAYVAHKFCIYNH